MGHCTPLTFNHWYTEIPDYLESLDADYVTMYESGYCMDKKVCVTPTEYHAVATRDHYVRKHTFEDPISADILIEQKIPPRVAGLSAADKERVVPAPEYFAKKDRTMARDILKTINVRKVRRSWKKKCGGSGIRLLNELRDYAATIGPSANNAISAKLQRAVERGPDQTVLKNSFEKPLAASLATQEPEWIFTAHEWSSASGRELGTGPLGRCPQPHERSKALHIHVT